MQIRGAMPTWALIPFATSPSYIGLWYLLGAPQRFSSPTFGAAKSLAPMQVWGLILVSVGAWIWAEIWLHRDAAHDQHGHLSTPRTLVLAFGLIFGCAFASWWGVVGTVQALRDPAATPTGIGWLSLVAFAYLLAALRVASGRGDG